MKISIKILLLTFVMLTLAACSVKKTGNQKFSFKVAALHTGLALNGGSFVRAINASSNTLIKLDANDSAEFEHGIWEFQTVSFEGPGAYAGRRFCGRAVGVNLNETQKNISLNISEANCYSEPFLSLMTLINSNFNASNFLTISDISPKSGPAAGGSTVTISGSGFNSGAVITIGGNVCSGLSFVNSSTLTCILPAHALGVVSVNVTNPDSQMTSAANFFAYRAAPLISSVTPAIGADSGGTTITILGDNFVTGAIVTLNGVNCTFPVVTSLTSLTCTTPPHTAGSVEVVVRNLDNQMSPTMPFTYLPMPTISSISPDNGPIAGGTPLTIAGTGFVSISHLMIGGSVCASLNIVSPTEMTCVTTASAAGIYGATISNMAMQSSALGNAFTFNPPPVASIIDYNSGPLSGGTLITINGTGFMTGAIVKIGGVICTSPTVTPNSIVCQTPYSSVAGTKSVEIFNPDMQSSLLAGGFTYRQSFVSTWRTTTPNETITLPLASGLNYNFYVDWGDGTPKTFITSVIDTDKTHTYAVAGDYTVTINGRVEGWNFSGANAASSSKIISVSSLGDMGWKNLNLAFYNCINLTSFVGGITNDVTNMSGMFKQATALSTIDVSTMNTSAVTNMSYMFSGASSLSGLSLSNFNTQNVTNMEYMFNEMTSLTALDLSAFNTANVTNMDHMFYGTTSLTSLNVLLFDTSKVTLMSYMFGHTNILPSLDVSSFNTSMVLDMSYMFEQAQGLTSLDLSNFNTSNVNNMYSMFNNASNISTLDISSFNTSNVVSMGSMFANMDGLTSLNLSHFDTSNVTNMGFMFNGSANITELILNNFDLTSVTAATDIFYDTHVSLIVRCDQGGSPATGLFFGKSCQ